MRPKTDNSTVILAGARNVRTLRDILPETPGLHVLFVAKVPAPASVESGHYFLGAQGRMFWRRLKEYGLLTPTTTFEDDSLLDHGYGLTDIVKAPRGYGDEPSDEEYRAGLSRILELIRLHRPKVVVFVYKRVLDNILRIGFGLKKKGSYGFNNLAERHFGTRVFVFPMPGTPCTKARAVVVMKELAVVCRAPAAT